MHLNILAFDFDGTLAEDGYIAEATYQRLEQAHLGFCSSPGASPPA